MRWLLVLAALTRIARADDGGYATLDRQDRATKLGAALTYFSVPHASQWARLDLSGEVELPSTGLGLYGQMPFAFESDPSGNQVFALGGLELGALLATRGGFVIHAGVVLPTGSSGDNAHVIAPTVAARQADLIQGLPNSTSVRAGVAYELRSGELFGRLEVGVDAPLLVDDATFTSSDLYLHLNGALGFDADDFTLAVETTNAFAIGSSSTVFDAVAAAIRLRAGCTRPYLAAIVPLDAQQSEPRVAFVVGVEQRY